MCFFSASYGYELLITSVTSILRLCHTSNETSNRDQDADFEFRECRYLFPIRQRCRSVLQAVRTIQYLRRTFAQIVLRAVPQRTTAQRFRRPILKSNMKLISARAFSKQASLLQNLLHMWLAKRPAKTS